MLNYFQSRAPITVKAYDMMEDLQIFFNTNLALSTESTNKFFEGDGEGLNRAEIKRVLDLFMLAFHNASEKLAKYMTPARQPAIHFLMECRIFNPARVVVLSHNVKDFSHIPPFDMVPEDEFQKYVTNLAPAAVAPGFDGNHDAIQLFWNSMGDRLPNMASIVLRYLNAISNSADAERSFSLYNMIVTNRRRSLSQKSIKALVYTLSCHVCYIPVLATLRQ